MLVAVTGSFTTSGDLSSFGGEVDAAKVGMAAVGIVTVASALHGAAHPQDHWRRVDGVHARLLLQPRRHGVGAALALRF